MGVWGLSSQPSGGVNSRPELNQSGPAVEGPGANGWEARRVLELGDANGSDILPHSHQPA